MRLDKLTIKAQEALSEAVEVRGGSGAPRGFGAAHPLRFGGAGAGRGGLDPATARRAHRAGARAERLREKMHAYAARIGRRPAGPGCGGPVGPRPGLESGATASRSITSARNTSSSASCTRAGTRRRNCSRGWASPRRTCSRRSRTSEAIARWTIRTRRPPTMPLINTAAI